MEEYVNWTKHPEVSTAKAKRIHAADAETMMAEGNGDKLVQATPRERSKKYPSDATVTKEYCQNTAEAGASEIHFVFDPATNERSGMPIGKDLHLTA